MEKTSETHLEQRTGIYIVEDYDSFRNILELIVRESDRNYKVTSSPRVNGYEGTPGLIILGDMPGFTPTTNYDAARVLKSKYPHVPIINLTTKNGIHKKYDAEMKNIGVELILPKEDAVITLHEAIERYLPNPSTIQ